MGLGSRGRSARGGGASGWAQGPLAARPELGVQGGRDGAKGMVRRGEKGDPARSETNAIGSS